MIRLIAVLLCIGVAPFLVSADNCVVGSGYGVQQVRQVQYVQHHAQQVQHYVAPIQHHNYNQQLLIRDYVPYPSYSLQDEVDQLKLQLDVLKLRKEVQFMKQQMQDAPAVPMNVNEPVPAPVPMANASLAQQSCLMCHDASVAKTKGGGLNLFQAGQLVPLSDADLLKVADRVLNGEMPPKKTGITLTGRQRVEVLCELKGSK